LRIVFYHLPVQLPVRQAPRGPFVNIMPVGLLALSAELERVGHVVEVVHAGVESRRDAAFSVADDTRAQSADLVALALHWHYQLGPVSRAVAELHAQRADLPVVVGGMTASAFAEDILRDWPGVDFVLTGEAELGLAELAEVLGAGRSNFDEVSNLVYRAGSEIQRSPKRYLASQAELDALEFARFDLLRHHQSYNAQFAEDQDGGWSHPNAFYVATGRGCSVDCAFCSGGRSGHRALAGRTEVLFRSAARVLHDLELARSFGARTACFCFDPPPHSDRYHRELFSLAEGRLGDLEAVFEGYRPPSAELLGTFARCFPDHRGRVTLSPTVADERLRRKLLGAPYSNAELERALIRCQSLGIDTSLYFAAVPQETEEQFDASLRWQQTLARRYGCRLICSPLEIEPHAPWTLNPGALGLRAARTDWAGFLGRHGREATLGVSHAREVGYEFPDVDARLVRVASIGLDPLAETGRALAFCGQTPGETCALVAPGHLEDLAAVLHDEAGRPLTVVVHEDDGETAEDASLAAVLGRSLGPQVRLTRLRVSAVRHLKTNGQRPPPQAGEGTLTVLHVRDHRSAERMFGSPGWPVPFPATGAVVAETCRWTHRPCPATRPGLLAWARDGAVRCCPSSPNLSGARIGDVRQKLSALAAETEARRGCGACPARDDCARCMFTGPVSEQEYCAIRRDWSARGWQVKLTAVAARSSPAGAAIGWDQ
jgi:radical SAM superfamily enzyme YgiQ (UPF0313 family)